MVLEELVRLSTARAEEGRREVGPFSRASQDFKQSLLARRNQTYTTLFSSNQEKTKGTLACITSSYLLFILPCLCISKIFTPSAIPFNGARNACWHFLAQSLGTVVLSSSLATAPEMLGWYVLTFTERSASTRIYHCSISPRSIQGIVIYIFPRDGEVV